MLARSSRRHAALLSEAADKPGLARIGVCRNAEYRRFSESKRRYTSRISPTTASRGA